MHRPSPVLTSPIQHPLSVTIITLSGYPGNITQLCCNLRVNRIGADRTTDMDVNSAEGWNTQSQWGVCVLFRGHNHPAVRKGDGWFYDASRTFLGILQPHPGGSKVVYYVNDPRLWYSDSVYEPTRRQSDSFCGGASVNHSHTVWLRTCALQFYSSLTFWRKRTAISRYYGLEREMEVNVMIERWQPNYIVSCFEVLMIRSRLKYCPLTRCGIKKAKLMQWKRWRYETTSTDHDARECIQIWLMMPSPMRSKIAGTSIEVYILFSFCE